MNPEKVLRFTVYAAQRKFFGAMTGDEVVFAQLAILRRDLFAFLCAVAAARMEVAAAWRIGRVRNFAFEQNLFIVNTRISDRLGLGIPSQSAKTIIRSPTL